MFHTAYEIVVHQEPAAFFQSSYRNRAFELMQNYFICSLYGGWASSDDIS